MPIYLDNAATSFPKPDSVHDVMDRVNRELSVAAGRGKYLRAVDADRILSQTRNMLASLINAPDSSLISFAFSGTDALSTAILGFVKAGDHVIATEAEHTSVLRPLWHLQRERDIELSIVPCDEHGAVTPTDIESAIRPNTNLICLTHASNVTGAVQPIADVAAVADANGIALLLDAAQTAGCTPIDVAALNCDILAAPGHKSLLGPLGTGFLYTSANVVDSVQPLRFGGTGSTGNEFDQPSQFPQKFEAGNLNVPAIAGLLEGLKWLQTDESNSATENAVGLARKLESELRTIAGVEVYSPPELNTSVVSFNFNAIDCQTAGMVLDSQYGIECRTGLHCAPLIHQRLGSFEKGGTVRFSPGVFTTELQVEETIAAVKAIAEEMSLDS